MITPKQKFLERIYSFITFHPWLKLIALALAVITWFYVRGERILSP